MKRVMLRALRLFVLGVAVIQAATTGCVSWSPFGYDGDPDALERHWTDELPRDPATAYENLGWAALLHGGSAQEASEHFSRARGAGATGWRCVLGAALADELMELPRSAVERWGELVSDAPLALRQLGARRLLAHAETVASLGEPRRQEIGEVLGHKPLGLPVLEADLRQLLEDEQRPLPVGTVTKWDSYPFVESTRPLGVFREGKASLRAGTPRPEGVDPNGYLRRKSERVGLRAASFGVRVSEDVRVYVDVQSETSFRLHVNQLIVVEQDITSGFVPPRRGVGLELLPGHYEFLLEMAVAQPGNGCRVRVVSASHDAEGKYEMLPTSQASVGPKPRPRLWHPERAPSFEPLELEAWTTARSMFDDERPLAASRALRRALRKTPRALGLRTWEALGAAADPIRGRDASVAEEGRLLRLVLDGDPTVALALAMRVRILLEEGRSEEALQKVGQGEKLSPRSPVWDRLRYEIYSDAGWKPEARAALTRAIGREPADCLLRRWWVELEWEGLRTRGEWPSAQLEERCPTLRALHAEMLLRAGRAEEASELLEAQVEASGGSRTLRRVLAQAELLARKLTLGTERLEQLVEEDSGDADAMAALADVYMAQGRREEARALRERLARIDEASASLRRQMTLVSGRPFWGRYRLDSRRWRAATRARAEQLAPEADGIVLLDQRVSRFFEDGRGLHYTHVMILVRSAKGAESFGEVAAPSSGELVLARTLKADGSIVEPEDLPDKATLSMPALEAGDVIDIAYVSPSPPRPFIGPLFVSDDFFLESYQAPILHSEWTVVTPRDMPVEADVHGRLEAEEQLVEDGLVARTWRRQDSRRPQLEPHIPDPRATLTFVRAGTASWKGMAERLADNLLLLTRPSPALRQRARRIEAAHGSTEGRVRAAFSFVQREILDDKASFLAIGAARSIADGRGERVVALLGLLREMGVPADGFLVKPVHRVLADGTVPDLVGYSYPVVRVQLDDGPVWLEPSMNHMAFGYLPPVLQKRPAIAVADGIAGRRVTTPELGLSREERDIELRLHLSDDGRTLSGQAVDRARGILAVNLRELFGQASGDERRQLLTQLARSACPRALVHDWSFENLDDAELPLVMRYEWSAALDKPPVPGPPQEIALGLFSERLAPTWTPMPWRRHPLLLNVAIGQRIDVSLSIPSGARIVESPDGVSLSGAFGRYDLDVRIEEGPQGERIFLRKELAMPLRVVEPARYPELARQCRSFDRADQVTIKLRWRR